RGARPPSRPPLRSDPYDGEQKVSNFSIDGLVTGLNTTQIISQLMYVERQPETQMQTQKTALDAQAKAWADLTATMTSLSNASSDLVAASKLALFSATSNSSFVTATASASAKPGSITFQVQRLATAHQVASGGVASASTTIGAGTATLGSGLPALGFSGAVADSALAAGHHALVVTQSSQAATVAAGQWGGTVTVGPANDQLTISVNGQTRVITIADGTYSSITALASAVGAAAGTDVSVTATGGHLNISTVAEGSSATLQVSGGTALTTLGLTVGASATGTDGVVSLDGVSTTVSSVTQGAQLTLPSTGGNLSVTIGGGLRAGGGTVQVLRSGAATTPTSLAADLTTADAGLSTQL